MEEGEGMEEGSRPLLQPPWRQRHGGTPLPAECLSAGRGLPSRRRGRAAALAVAGRAEAGLHRDGVDGAPAPVTDGRQRSREAHLRAARVPLVAGGGRAEVMVIRVFPARDHILKRPGPKCGWMLVARPSSAALSESQSASQRSGSVPGQ